ncbi:hypothetical protein JT27_18470 [Alcaligenes faecalis]|uniref:phage tail tube protein n=1 Tax=Alcaligenes faecalis TaxID=511 RepID=UPI00052CF4EF|nr:hypothetical protein [Alcaligenes faecalis]KGP00311.1 hypothetical protein JT27_18470 [Alcaligenes faecalis]
MATVRPIPQSYYYSGQGRLFMGERDPVTGRPLSLIPVGNVPELEISIAVTKFEHKESMSGQRSVDLTVITEKTPTISITLESLDPRTLAMGLWGISREEAGATVTAETIKIKPGMTFALANPGVEDVVIQVAGADIDEATNYDIDPGFGTIYVKADAADITAEVEATISYKHGDTQRLDALMTETPPERFLRFEGLNTVNGDLVLVEIPRVSFEPIASLPLINEELAQAEITANILLDPLVVTQGVSQFFTQRIVKPAVTP